MIRNKNPTFGYDLQQDSIPTPCSPLQTLAPQLGDRYGHLGTRGKGLQTCQGRANFSGTAKRSLLSHLGDRSLRRPKHEGRRTNGSADPPWQADRTGTPKGDETPLELRSQPTYRAEAGLRLAETARERRWGSGAITVASEAITVGWAYGTACK